MKAVTYYKGNEIVAMIPARMGSTRLPKKNLALLKGKPLIYYAIKTARESGVFSHVVVNSEDAIFKNIAKRYNAEFYLRPSKWATSSARSDSVVYDFAQNNRCDIIVWVNPTSPLQSPEEIRNAVDYFLKNRLDSLITVKNEQVHCIFKNKPVNFKRDGIFARTQDLIPVQPFVYSVMMWRRDTFIKTFRKKGHAIFCGRTGYYPVSRLSSLIIKKEEDLILADFLMASLGKRSRYRVRYDKIASV